MAKGRAISPFNIAAPNYHGAGWSPIPLKINEKSPVPPEFTGVHGKYVDDLQLKRWMKGEIVKVGNMTYRPGNIALRMPRNVIGIDVDMYDGKAGRATLAEAEERWGPLPKTWTSTSRTDGSGIRFFRIPEGLAWPGGVGPGIELVRWDHRYAMVFPSVHDKTRKVYQWLNPKGKLSTDYFPAPAELPKLPKAWVKGLTSGKKWKARAVADMDDSDIALWLSDRPDPDDPCDLMRTVVRTGGLKIMKAGPDGGAHDAARDAVWGVLRDSGHGHGGVRYALADLRAAFLAAVGPRRDKRQAEGEWDRLVKPGVASVAAEEGLSHEDPCIAIASGEIKMRKLAADGSVVEGEDGEVDLALNEQGNAQRLHEVVAGRLLWAKDLGEWTAWNENSGLWEPGDSLQQERWAMKALNLLKAEVDKNEDLDAGAKAAVRQHWKQSQKPAGIAGTLATLRARPGYQVTTADFDADPTALACSNGLIALTDSGGMFRHMLMRDDRVTLSTGTEYKRDAYAESVHWKAFLERIQPDPEVRAWIQRLAGYSLLGHNSARKIIVCMGPTTTGKGTFIAALSNALGQYTLTTNLTIFRDNQDERPRVDLVDALPKRIVFIDEASHNWKLHPDQIKRITGAGKISARRPYARTAVSVTPAFTPWLMTNSVPSIEGADKAVRKRLLVVPFAEEISSSEEDISLGDKLASESSAILAWALEGYDSLLRMGFELGLASPDGAKSITNEFFAGMSNFDAFIAECCATGDEHSVEVSVINRCWEDWQDDNGIQARDRMSSRQFAFALKANGYGSSQTGGGRSNKRVRNGLKLNKHYSKQYEND